jgi:hypothetical protein
LKLLDVDLKFLCGDLQKLEDDLKLLAENLTILEAKTGINHQNLTRSTRKKHDISKLVKVSRQPSLNHFTFCLNPCRRRTQIYLET